MRIWPQPIGQDWKNWASSLLVQLKMLEQEEGGSSGGSGVPSGGTTGQSLVKTSNADYDVGWATVSGGGGLTDAPSDGSYYGRRNGAWTAVAAASHTHSGLAPTGGTTGQVLKKVSNTNFDYAWASLGTGVTFEASTVEPVGPALGMHWFDQNTGILYVRVTDGVDEVWFEDGGGGASTPAYTHTQGAAATTWTINHNLGYYPTISLRTVGGVEFEGEITHTSVNQAVVTLVSATAGTARCT